MKGITAPNEMPFVCQNCMQAKQDKENKKIYCAYGLIFPKKQNRCKRQDSLSNYDHWTDY